MTLYGIDVSHYQGALNWPSIARQGIHYAPAKATQGVGVDSTFHANVSGARAAGLIPGAYHFLDTSAPVASQVAAYVHAVGNFSGLIAALDVEAPGLTYAMVHAFVVNFKLSVPGHPIFVYTGISEWRSKMGNQDMTHLGPLWLAYYPGGGYPGDGSPIWNTVLGGQKPVMWQYGPRILSGHPAVDGDAYRGTMAQLEAYTSGTGNLPNQPGADMSYGVDHFPFPEGPRLWRVTKGTTLTGWDPAKPGKPVVTATFKADSGAHASGTAAITQYPDPSVTPHGAPFLLVIDGTFKGLYIQQALVTLVNPPPPAPCLTQADVDKARHDGAVAQSSVDANALTNVKPT